MGVKTICEKCAMIGSEICGICDPDLVDRVIGQGEKLRSPTLCSTHMKEHRESHCGDKLDSKDPHSPQCYLPKGHDVYSPGQNMTSCAAHGVSSNWSREYVPG